MDSTCFFLKYNFVNQPLKKWGYMRLLQVDADQPNTRPMVGGPSSERLWNMFVNWDMFVKRGVNTQNIDKVFEGNIPKQPLWLRLWVQQHLLQTF